MFRRRGFTLVELLVVIAIIAMLVTLLLPAVQAARAAARRTQCTNNVKNLCLGILNYESATGKIPPGWIGVTNNQAEWAWTSFILPYIEEQGLYDGLGVGDRRLHDVLRSNDPALLQIAATPIEVFTCPSDEAIEQLRGGNATFSAPIERHFVCSGCPRPNQWEPARSNYMGVCGMWDAFGNSVQAQKNNGVIFGNSDITLAHISDGTSKTFAIGERDRRCRQGAWIGVRNPPGPDLWGSYFVRGRVSIRVNDPRSVDALVSRSCTEGFSSAHEGGAFFGFMDGHVQFITDDISYANGGINEGQLHNRNNPPPYDSTRLGVYQRFGIRNDGAAGVDDASVIR